VAFAPPANLSGGQILAQVETHVTFLSLSGTNMYSVLPLLFTSIFPKPGTDRVETTTDFDAAPDANGTVAMNVVVAARATSVSSAFIRMSYQHLL
jgi:hypothetical protein